MSITRSAVRNITRSVVRDVVRSGDSVVQRHFTTIGATLSQYYSIPSVTVDRIVMDVYSPGGVADGLPTGASTPTANKLDTLDFVYSGTIDEIGRNGATYVPDGTIIANVELYFSGTLIHSYSIDEDLSIATTIVDSVGSNDGTAVNIVDSMLFTETDLGWESGNLWRNGVVIPDGTAPRFSIISGSYSGQLPEYAVFRSKYDWVNLTGRLSFLIAGNEYSMPTEVTGESSSRSEYIESSSSTRAVVQERSTVGTVADSVTLTIKQVLEYV